MSLAVRVIPCLDVDAGRVVKGVNFENLRDAGDPVELARLYDAENPWHPMDDFYQRLDLAAPQLLAQLFDRVGSHRHAQHPRLGRGVEGRPGVLPPPFQGRAHRRGLRVARHDRHDSAGGGTTAQLVENRVRLFEVAKYAMAQHGGEALTVYRLVGVVAVVALVAIIVLAMMLI